MQLRPYQEAAVQSGMTAISSGHNPVLQLATGTGKSVIIAEMACYFRLQGKNVWILTHVQQLVKQNAKTYKEWSGTEPAIVCAGLNRKDTDGMVTYGTIQSMKGVLAEMEDPDIIIIDEAHRVPHDAGEASLYGSILTRFSDAQRIAMTATPWRMDNGIIYGKGEEFFFDKIAYNYNVTRAVKDGWLCPLAGVETAIQLNVDDITVNGDFVQSEVTEAMTWDWIRSVCDSVNELASKRNYIAVYCPTIKAAQFTAKAMEVTGRKVGLLTGDMNQAERDNVYNSLADGSISVICSVDMITTGFDFPALDCIVCLRPTLSSSLWVQIQGRGTRLHPSKKNCLILDYAGNLIRLGGVDMYDTFYKENGEEVEAIPQQPYEKKPRTLYPGLTTLNPIDPMTGDVAHDNTIINVTQIHKINAVALNTRRGKYPMLMVQYTCSTAENARINASMFINTEEPKEKDLAFFEQRRMAIRLPNDAKKVSYQIKDSTYPTSIKVKKNGKYWNVVGESFGEVA